MKKGTLILLALCLLCLIGFPSCSGRDSIPDLNMATLKSLVELNGEELSWDSFAPYYYIDESSEGMCVLRYPIGEEYALVISGESKETPPASIRLVSVQDPNRSIDVRTESIDDFLSANP